MIRWGCFTLIALPTLEGLTRCYGLLLFGPTLPRKVPATVTNEKVHRLTYLVREGPVPMVIINPFPSGLVSVPMRGLFPGALLHSSRGEGLPRGVVDRTPTPVGWRFIGAPAVTDYPKNHLTLKPPYAALQHILTLRPPSALLTLPVPTA